MTGHQKEHITAMRMQGIGYSTIGKSLGLKKETVAAFCRKNGLSGVKAADNRVIPFQTDTCLVCGTVLVQIPGKKETSFLFVQVPYTLVERTPGCGDTTLSSAGTAESPLWLSETAAGNTVPFPAPSLKGAIPMPESNRERLEHYLSARLCVKRMHSLWLYLHKPTPKCTQYSPESTPQLRPVYTATMACYLPPSMVIYPMQRRRQHEKGNKTAK